MIGNSLDRFEAAIRLTMEKVGFTNISYAVLGNEQNQVVVPHSERIAPGAMWLRPDNQLPSQAINTPWSGLTYDNSSAGVEVFIGFLPNKRQGVNDPYIIGITERGLQKTGGVTPFQYGLFKAQNPQVENILNLQLKPGTDPLSVGINGGWYTIGLNEYFMVTTDNLLDLSAYVPTTPGYARYVIICLDTAKQGAAVARDEFDTTVAYNPYEQIEGELPEDVWKSGYVRLDYGDTGVLERKAVVPSPQIFTGTSSGGGSNSNLRALIEIGW